MFSPCALGWPPLLLDGAHNSHGFAALGLSLAREGVAPLAVVFACLGDKDLETLLPHLWALATGLIVVPPIADNPRAMPPAELAARIGLNAVPAGSLTQALEIAAQHMAVRMPEVFDPACIRARQHPLLLCGSLYLLGEFYALRPDALEHCALENR
jgi:dihydrofolate synthase/folylpolyglutamate synthase